MELGWAKVGLGVENPSASFVVKEGFGITAENKLIWGHKDWNSRGWLGEDTYPFA